MAQRWAAISGLIAWVVFTGQPLAGEPATLPTEMLKLKTGVNPKGIQPELLLAIQIVTQIYKDYGYDAVITSLFDGKHGAHTLHQRDGICRAADFRTKHVKLMDKAALVQSIKDAVGDNYDVLLEHVGEVNEHLHLEFDQKIQVAI